MLWFLRRGLEGVASVQRYMVEKRIERVREKEKSVLYKAATSASASRRVGSGPSTGAGMGASAGAGAGAEQTGSRVKDTYTSTSQPPEAVALSEADSREIEGQLSAEQLQLFAEENDSMLKHYEDTLGKVQYVENLTQ